MTRETSSHIPVMLKESLNGLNVRQGLTYVDATIGLGGHSQEILKMGGKVIGIDQDELSLSLLADRLKHPNLILVHGNFSRLTDLVRGVTDHQISGVLMDLGTSARQLQDPTLGLSFQTDADLDMRLSPELALKAKDLVNGLSEKDLYVIFAKNAQEIHARSIARALIRARTLKPITRTSELAGLITRVYGNHRGKIHPATKVFQALRIAVNDEFNNLKAALPQAVKLLSAGGRLVVISFHEGEDRLVKQFVKDQNGVALTILTPKPLIPSSREISRNIRSRSAKLRVAEKI